MVQAIVLSSHEPFVQCGALPLFILLNQVFMLIQATLWDHAFGSSTMLKAQIVLEHQHFQSVSRLTFIFPLSL